MSIKNILVAYNGTKNNQPALKLAQEMATRYKAHLTGILAHGMPNMMFAYGGHITQSMMDDMNAADKQHREAVRQKFKAGTKGFPAANLHYLEAYGPADEMLMEIALGYDLVVMGAGNKRSDYPHMEVHADVVARHSGKPVLVVPPPNGQPAVASGKVLLAWDGKRTASRAMGEAIRLLPSGTEISVLCIGAEKQAKARALPALTHLERHGFVAKPIILKTRKIAKAILRTAKEIGADMLVMGAYEHAKLAEDLFGGVTKTVLKKSRIPVLLSH
ncbi:MAG: universal stress protein [Rhodobacteraceae bacterium]|nr:universal stress protein [Paracoccaceae bacterium]